MKSLSVKKGQLHREVSLPSSKSYANRALIIAALKTESTSLINLPKATDVTILVECLKKIGLEINNDKGMILFKNHFPACENGDHILEVGEGGTTARFLATMLLLGKYRYSLLLGERLKDRPWDDFVTVANKLGAKAQLKDNVLSIQGPVDLPSELEIDCSHTTQFATAFQLLSISKNIKVVPFNMHSSKSYWDMTEKMLALFRKESTYTIPLDWSSAAYPMAFAALNHKIHFPGLFPDTFQSDSKLYGILSSLGCLEENPEGITVSPIMKQRELTLDVSDCLDLVPALSYLLAHIDGTHKITGFGNLIHKESNRLEEVLKLLTKFERRASVEDGTLCIHGRTERDIGTLELVFPNDHRMVMAGTLFLLHHSGGTVFPMEAIAKSYPDFFSLIQE